MRYKGFILILIALMMFVTGCTSSTVGDSKFKEVKEYDDDKYYAYIENYLSEARNVKDLETLIDMRINKVDDMGQRRLIHYYGYNLAENAVKYHNLLSFYNDKLLEVMQNPEFDEDKFLEEIDDEVLKTILNQIKENKLFVKYINDGVYVNIDYTQYKNKYGKYIPEDYQAYYSIMEDVENVPIIKNDQLVIENIENIIVKHRDFLQNHNESSLYTVVSNGYLSHFSFYLGLSNQAVLVNQDNTINEEMLQTYRDFADRNKDNELGEFILKIVEKMELFKSNYSQELDDEINNLLMEMYENLMKNMYEVHGIPENMEDVEGQDSYMDNILKGVPSENE